MKQRSSGAGAACAAFVLLLAASSAAWAQSYPTKPVRIVVPFAPGGAVDTVGRMVGQKLSEAWKQPVLVENRPGAGGIIAADMVAKSPPDGHTMLLATVALAVTPSVYRRLPYDPMKDLVPVTQVTAHPLVLTANPKLSASSLRELIAAAKSKPGSISYGSTGVGTSTQLLMEWLNIVAGINTVHVPYKGDAPQSAALLSGEVQLGLKAAIGIVSHIKNGRLRALGVTGHKRSALLPDVPTLAEAGLAGFDSGSWMGVFAPAGVPKEIVSQFQGEMAKVIRLPDITSRLAAQGFDPIGNMPQEFAARFQADHATYARIVKEARIPLQQ